MKKLKETIKKTISLILVIFVLSTSSPWYVIAQELKTNNGIQQVEQTEGNLVDTGSEGESTDEIDKDTTENKKTESSKDSQQIEEDNIGEQGSTEAEDLIQNSNEKTNEQAEENVALNEINQVMSEENVEEAEGFKIALRWAKSSDTNLDWHATGSEKKVMKLTFYYQNEVAQRDYEQNELKVAIPGIGNLNRSGAIKASDIAADVYGTSVFKRDWSYQYDSASDTYTFTNNHKIEKDSTFNGSFEMIWEFNSRDCVNDYNQEIKATLMADNEKIIESSPLNLHYTSDPDTYTITKKAQAVTSADGLSKFVKEGKKVSDYAWVKYTFEYGIREYKARGVKSTYILDKFPEGCVIASNSNVVNNDDGTQSYKFEETSVLDSSTAKKTCSVIVGYPVDEYLKEGESEKELTNTVHLYGSYNDEKEENTKEIANSSVKVTLEKIKQQVIGVTPDKYMSPTEVYKESLDGDLSFTATLEADATAAGDGEYKLVISDDYLELDTEGEETCKQLKKDDYRFTSVTIPGKDNCTNQNGYTLSDGNYKVELYVLYAEKVEDNNPEKWELDKYESIYNGNWEKQSKTVNIEKPAVAIRVEISGLTESVKNVRITSKLTVNISGYKEENPIHIINYDYTDILDNEGKSLIGNVQVEDYSSKKTLWERDNQVYKKGMARDSAMVIIKERPAVKETPGTYSSSVDIEPFIVDENIEYFTTKLHHSVNVNNKYAKEIKKIELYGITQREELETLIETLQLTQSNLKFKNELSSDVDMTDYLKERATINKNGKEISIDFDFSDNPIISTNFSIGFTVDARINYENYYDTTNPTYAVTTNSYIDSEILDPISTTTYSGKTMATRSDSQSILLALASHQQIIKLVKTKYSGDFVQDNAVAPMGSEYTYRLKLRNGYNTLDNTKIIDILEHADLTKLEDGKKYETSEWYGTFKNVDTSYIEKQGLHPKVYYTDKIEITGQTDWREMQKDDEHKWTPKNGEDTNNVRAVKVEIEGEIAENSIVYVDVNMTAPNGEEYVDKHTYNSYTINCDAKDLYTGEKSSYMDNMPSNMVDVKLVKKAYNVIITKIDAKTKNKLSGVEFEIYKGEEKIKTYTTGILGNIVIASLNEGTYIIKEKNPPTGYEKIGDYTLTIEDEKYILVDDNGNTKEEKVNISQPVPTIYINVENNRAKGSITIHKIDEYRKPKTDEDSDEKGEEQPLVGVEFELQKADGEEIRAATTNEKGEAKFDDLEWGEVYVIKEKNTLQGYELAPNQNTYLSRLDINKTVTIENKRKTGSVTLTKQDEKEDIKLSGATYGLYAKEKIYDKDGSVLYVENQLIKEEKTDEHGQVVFDTLSWGKYYMKETETIYGYELSDEEHEFTINEKNVENLVQITVNEKRCKAKLQLIKIDENETFLPGAEFELFKEDGTKVPKINAETEQEEPYVTDKTGYLNIEDIEWGEYYIQETKSPQGYEENDTKYYFTVNRETFANENKTVTSVRPEKLKDGNTDSEDAESEGTQSKDSQGTDKTEDVEEKVSSIKNKRKTGKVILTKYATDEKGTEEKNTLSGAVYELYLADGTLIKEEITDENGKITIEDLQWGSYYFQEKQAPDGYSISEQKIAFVINSENVDFEQQLSAYDKPQTGEIKINKTISTNSVYNAHGNATFIFKIVGKDEKGEVKVELYKAITFTEQDLKNCGEGENITKTITISNVEAYKYEITEEENYRYELSEITPVTTNASIDAENKQKGIIDLTKKAKETTESDTQKQAEETGETEGAQEKKGEITFKNDKQNNSLLTDNGLITNSAQSQYYLIGISAQPNQESYTVGKALEKDDFTYTLYYSGGQKEEKETLTEGEITFNGKSEYTADNAGDYLVEMEYTLNGKTYRTTVATKWVMPDDFFTYESLSDGNIAITGIDPKYISPEVLYIPGEYNGHNVTQINELSNIDNVISVEISEGITSILNRAFYNHSKIQNIKLASTLETIGLDAFCKCVSLEEIDLSNTKVTAFENGINYNNKYAIFFGCSNLKSVKLPSNFKKIGNYTFYGCSKLTNINIPEGLTDIGTYAFYKCESLTDKEIPGSVTSIGNYAFSYCSSLTSIDLSKTQMTSIQDGVFYQCSNVTSVQLPDTIISIGERAFNSCTSLVSIDLSTINLTEIKGKYDVYSKFAHNGAFANCTNLEEIKLPNTLEKIKDDVFAKCTSLKSIDIPTGVTEIGGAAFYGCTGLITIDLSNTKITAISGKLDTNNCYAGVFTNCTNIVEIKIPNNINSIGECAFYNCMKLKNLDVPKTVTSIGKYAFSRCKELESIDLSGLQIASIENYLFEECSSLTSIGEIPSTVTSIGIRAFYGCSSLTTIGKIPKTVTSIGYGVFYGCTSLERIDVEEENEKFSSDKGILYDKEKTNLICVPALNKETSYIGPTTLMTISEKAFEENDAIQTVDLSKTQITIIEKYVFHGCSNLESINLGELQITSIGENAFEECRKLNGIDLSKTKITVIKHDTFRRCSKLLTIDIPNSVKTVEYQAFSDSGLKTINFYGTEEEFNEINVSSQANSAFKSSKVQYK